MNIALLGIPFDGNSSFERGPAKAPAVIREVLNGGSLNSGCENGCELKNNVRWLDCGDLIIDNKTSENRDGNHFVQSIEQAAAKLLANNFAAACSIDWTK